MSDNLTRLVREPRLGMGPVRVGKNCIFRVRVAMSTVCVWCVLCVWVATWNLVIVEQQDFKT